MSQDKCIEHVCTSNEFVRNFTESNRAHIILVERKFKMLSVIKILRNAELNEKFVLRISAEEVP